MIDNLTIYKAAHRASVPWIVMRDLCSHGQGPLHVITPSGTRYLLSEHVDRWIASLDSHPMAPAIRQVQRYYRSPDRRPVPQQRCPFGDPNRTDPCNRPEPMGWIARRALIRLRDGQIRPTG